MMTRPEFGFHTECPTCGGEGGWDVPTHINRTHGGWDGYRRTCPTCGGAGWVEEEGEQITLEELLDIDEEKLDAMVREDAARPFKSASIWLLLAGLAALITSAPVSAADWCMPRHMPPPGVYSADPPPGTRVITLPLDHIVAAGRLARGGQAVEATRSGAVVLGSADPIGRSMVIPRRRDLPAECWSAIRAHEAAHLQGWRHQ